MDPRCLGCKKKITVINNFLFCFQFHHEAPGYKPNIPKGDIMTVQSDAAVFVSTLVPTKYEIRGSIV